MQKDESDTAGQAVTAEMVQAGIKALDCFAERQSDVFGPYGLSSWNAGVITRLILEAVLSRRQ
jgi:hypothetical protein